MMLPPPKPPPRPPLQIRHNPPSPEELIFQANALLSLGQARKAIDLYTDVLYIRAPGHIVAFLNRSMAYICEGRPELAAVDAYRAAQAMDMIKNYSADKRRMKEVEIKRYLRMEGLRIIYGHDWTKGDRRYIPGLGASIRRPLASLVMDMDDADCPVWHDHGLDLKDMFPRLELRALYRLCGALYRCKGGASQDALGVLSDIPWMYTCFASETRCFQELGKEILNTLTQVIDIFRKEAKDTNDEHIVVIEAGDNTMLRTKPQSMLKTRVTQHRAMQYWNDIYEPDFTKSETHHELRAFASVSSDSCQPVAVNQSNTGLLPQIEMRASKDHLPGDVLFSERSPWHVTTSSSERVLDAWCPNKAGNLRFYCDTCATAILMPTEMVTDISTQSAPRITREEIMADLSDVVDDDGVEGEKQRRRRRRAEWSASTHISFCSRDHEALYCSTTCRRNRRSFDPGIHESKLETELRNGKIRTETTPKEEATPGHPRSLYVHSKTQTLYDILIFRIYASALNEGKHPLELVKFIRGNLSPPVIRAPGQPVDKRSVEIPWSFNNNIVRPLWIINRYHQALGQDPLNYIRESDGWVINTLVAKIWHSTEITRGAMSAIVFNMDKESKSYCYRGLEEWVSDRADAVYESKEAYCETWVARLDPLISMIRVADETKGEKPNCWLKYEESIQVIAGQPDDPRNKKDVAIKQGEVLLRPKMKFLGGSPYEVTPYSQRDPVLSSNTFKDDPVEQDTIVDHKPITVDKEAPNSPLRDQVSIPDSAEDSDSDSDSSSSGSDDSSDVEMLEILDEEEDDEDDSPSPPDSRPEFLTSPKSPPPSENTTTDIAALDGQAETDHKSTTSSVALPSIESNPDHGNESPPHHCPHKDKKRRLSVDKPAKTKLGKKHWSGHTRVRRNITFRPPRNSLYETKRVRDVQRICFSSPQQELQFEAERRREKEEREMEMGKEDVGYDSFDDVPVGKMVFDDNVKDKDEDKPSMEEVGYDSFDDVPVGTMVFDDDVKPSMEDVRERARALVLLRRGGVSPAAGSPDMDVDGDKDRFDEFKRKEVGRQREKSPGKRTFSVAMRGVGEHDHDPGEGSSGSVKGKEKMVIRGGGGGGGFGEVGGRWGIRGSKRARTREGMDRVQAWFLRG